APAAQRDHASDRLRDVRHCAEHAGHRDPELPWPRHPAAYPGLGDHDRRRTELPHDPVAADHDPRPRGRAHWPGAVADRRRPRRPAPAGGVMSAPGIAAQLAVSDLSVEIAGQRGVVRPVDGVSLTVPPGEAVGLVGESGSGKSMTLKAILGVLPPEAKVTSGNVVLDGTDLTGLSNSRLNKVRGRRIAMIFQEPMSALNPVMRVGNQIAEGPRVHLGM